MEQWHYFLKFFYTNITLWLYNQSHALSLCIYSHLLVIKLWSITQVAIGMWVLIQTYKKLTDCHVWNLVWIFYALNLVSLITESHASLIKCYLNNNRHEWQLKTMCSLCERNTSTLIWLRWELLCTALNRPFEHLNCSTTFDLTTTTTPPGPMVDSGLC